MDGHVTCVVWDATGRAKIPCTSSYWALQTNLLAGQAYDLTGSSAFAKVTLPPIGTGTRGTFLNVFAYNNDPQNNKLWMSSDGNFITAYTTLLGVQTSVGSTAYNATTRAWWRIRETGGTDLLRLLVGQPRHGRTSHISRCAARGPTMLPSASPAGYYGTETAADAFVDNVNAGIAFGHRQQDDDVERSLVPSRPLRQHVRRRGTPWRG